MHVGTPRESLVKRACGTNGVGPWHRFEIGRYFGDFAKLSGFKKMLRGRRLRPHFRAVDCAGLRNDFLYLDATEEVVPESLWSAEELCLGSAHLYARVKFERNQVQCADKIGKLEKPVFDRADALRKLYVAGE